MRSDGFSTLTDADSVDTTGLAALFVGSIFFVEVVGDAAAAAANIERIFGCLDSGAQTTEFIRTGFFGALDVIWERQGDL